MTKQNKNIIKFNMNAVEGEYTLVPVGTYSAVVDKVALKTINGDERVWIGVRITGPKQAGRYITTLATLDDTAKSAYKTRSFFNAVGTMDMDEMIGKPVMVEVVQWTPNTTNETINDIRIFGGFLEKPAAEVAPTEPSEQEKLAELIEDVAENLSLPKDF